MNYVVPGSGVAVSQGIADLVYSFFRETTNTDFLSCGYIYRVGKEAKNHSGQKWVTFSCNENACKVLNTLTNIQNTSIQFKLCKQKDWI